MPRLPTPAWDSPLPPGKRLVFVAGLHRSATTLLARLLAEHPDCSGLTNTGAPMDEGQHVQTVIRDRRGGVLGGVGSMALKPGNRLTETSRFAGEADARRIWREWAPYWDLDKTVLVEKSPANLTKIRLLATLFPGAHFIVISRHPVAQAMAIRKWAANRTSLQHVADWAVAYRMARSDMADVPRVTAVRYEDLCAAPEETLARLFSALELPPGPSPAEPLVNSNDRYFEAWRARRSRLLFRAEERLIRLVAAGEARRWGYDLRPDRLEAVSPAGALSSSPFAG